MSDDTRERSRHAARDASAPPNGPDGNQTMFQPDGHLNVEMVSAWLDSPEDFNEQERLAIADHLAGCPACSQVATELTAIVRAFQALPLVETPQSFALTPQMAGLVVTPTIPATRQLEEPTHLHERQLERGTRKPFDLYEPIPWYERQMRALRWTTAVATMLFVFLISVDVLGNVGGGSDDDDDSAAFTTNASISTQAISGGAAAATTTTSAAMAAPENSEQDERARNSDAESTAASDDISGNQPVPTPASGAAATAETSGSDDSEESLSQSTSAEPTAEQADTMLAPEPTESGQADQAQQDDLAVAAYSGKDTVEESQESNTLHLIELALVIAIAWLIVAMIALPRLRRPAG